MFLRRFTSTVRPVHRAARTARPRERIGRPAAVGAAAVAAAVTLAGCGTGGHIDGGAANLALPELAGVAASGGVSGVVLLAGGMLVAILGLVFGFVVLGQIRRLPVHASMREVSELIYATSKAYLVKQGRFLLALWAAIAAVIVLYYAVLVGFTWGRTAVVIAFSLIGMAGSYSVAWFGIRVNTYANSRTSFAALEGKPLPVHRIPLKAGMSIGMVLISLELLMMLVILLLLPRAAGRARGRQLRGVAARAPRRLPVRGAPGVRAGAVVPLLVSARRADARAARAARSPR